MDESANMDYEVSFEAQLQAQRIAFGALVAIIDDGSPNGLAPTLSRVLFSLSDTIEAQDISSALLDISNSISER